MLRPVLQLVIFGGSGHHSDELLKIIGESIITTDFGVPKYIWVGSTDKNSR